MIYDTLFVPYMGNLDILCKVQEYKKIDKLVAV